jgi:hypothetical protein
MILAILRMSWQKLVENMQFSPDLEPLRTEDLALTLGRSLM